MIQMAIMGFGTIGSGVYDVVNTNRDVIRKNLGGEELDVKYVLDLREFPGKPVEKVLVHDVNTIMEDPEVKIVVETMGGVEPAFTFVSRALKAGKSVATSNKELVAKKGVELMELAKENHASFLFGASVGGGIPIIRPLVRCLSRGSDRGSRWYPKWNYELHPDKNGSGGDFLRGSSEGSAGQWIRGEESGSGCGRLRCWPQDRNPFFSCSRKVCEL